MTKFLVLRDIRVHILTAVRERLAAVMEQPEAAMARRLARQPEPQVVIHQEAPQAVEQLRERPEPQERQAEQLQERPEQQEPEPRVEQLQERPEQQEPERRMVQNSSNKKKKR